MSREKWESLTRKELQDLAQRKGVTGTTRKTKDELVGALVKLGSAGQVCVSVSGSSVMNSRVVLLSIIVAVMILSLILKRIFILPDFLKPSFFMVCAPEMVATLNTEINMTAKIILIFIFILLSPFECQYLSAST